MASGLTPPERGNGAPRAWTQAALLNLYSRLRGCLQSPLGRRLFENAYLLYKRYEAGPVGHLRAFIRPGEWSIDVGANIGTFALRFARWSRDGARVIAIEPEDSNFASLARRIAAAGAEGTVIAIRGVAAEKAGTLHLKINPDHPGDHRLSAAGQSVRATTLDELVDLHGNPNVGLVKIDVQGAETRVLRGATRLLSRCRPALFVELDDGALRLQGSSADELMAFLSERGYRPYRLRRFGAPLAWTPAGGHRGYEDVLFLASDGA